MGQLENKVAVITGGGTGIGRETALLFAKEGAKVVVTDINEQAAATTGEDIGELSGGQDTALHIKHDVSKEEDWVTVVDESVRTFGKIDVLFNNAGIYIIKPLVETTLEDWNRLMSINVTGVFLGMKHVIPVMAQHGGGSVINASSVAGLRGVQGHVLYGASKGAVRIMTKDVAVEYAKQNVRVNSIHPGYINTGMAELGAQAARTTTEELGKKYPLGRLGETKDVAQLVLFLASDNSSYMTGQEFVIDGGATARA
ncbi:glucose 1-dehydrogenase [Alicyclobacillus tolerans]|uniref:SDR family NAD(P)-dependent oxidoreductase n=1 Tax=Alicyclobacillus tolerans TaxID=90970 RepID=UPI001F015315|nr:glucose 1-dehydrogenase [Alicyclobacillus tolerans]MCF8564143.1 glucose 1-dehydrogenase [Alicyclobacillus tolerans]